MILTIKSFQKRPHWEGAERRDEKPSRHFLANQNPLPLFLQGKARTRPSGAPSASKGLAGALGLRRSRIVQDNDTVERM